ELVLLELRRGPADRREAFATPRGVRAGGVLVEEVALVVTAKQVEAPVQCQVPTGPRIGGAVDEVAGDDDPVNAYAVDLVEAGFERLEVAVYVTEHGET